MGGESFENRASAKTAAHAFKSLVEEARYQRGHGGYTGTIAEKSGFAMDRVKDGESIADAIDRLIDENEKWGDAACIDAGPCPKIAGNRIFVFCGIASS